MKKTAMKTKAKAKVAAVKGKAKRAVSKVRASTAAKRTQAKGKATGALRTLENAANSAAASVKRSFKKLTA